MTEGWVYKTSFITLKRAVEKHHLLENGEKVLVGVSGGVDSMVMLHLLNNFNQRRYKDWEIIAVHINPNFPRWQTKKIIKFFESLNVRYLIDDINVPQKLLAVAGSDKRLRPCFLCARERRKRLFEIAEQHGIRKIALAHHLEDVNETFFLNLFYVSEAKTFSTKQDFFHNQYHIIRPLYYFDKDFINNYAETYQIPVVKNKCPYDIDSERNRIRNLLNKYYTKNPRIKTNIFWGIKNARLDVLPFKSSSRRKVQEKCKEKNDARASVSQ